MQRFIDLIPGDLKHVGGAVFNSGKDAFHQPGAGLYLLGLNPGGRPETHVEHTVDFHSRKVKSRPDNWCEHRDESWDGRPPGTWRMQPRVLHVLNIRDRIGSDKRFVLTFKRCPPEPLNVVDAALRTIRR